MKTRIIIYLIVCLSTGTVFAQQKTVTLTGQLVNFSNQVMVEDLSEYQYLNIPSPDHIIMPDSANKFTITFKLAAPNYFRVGRNILYLSPGDKLDVVIDRDKPVNSTFKGIGADANNYLSNTPFPKGGSFLEAGKNLKPTPQETLAIILNEAAKREQQLAMVQQTSAEFKRLEEARIKADVLCSFAAVTAYAHISKKLTSPDDYIKSFNDAAATTKAGYEKNFIDASLLKLVVYRDVAEDIIAKAPLNANVQQIKDYYRAAALVDNMNRENDKAKLTGYSKSIDSIKTPGYRAAVKQHLASLLQFGKGDVAVNFTAVDLNGKKVTLGDLKGKVIYVDMWATWCGPCLAEMPKLEEVKAKYKDNADVVFLSLSIDDDNMIDRWKQNVAGRKADGYQWQINRNKLSAYNVTTIPRTLLIDKNFKIVSMSAPLPSAKNLSAAIDKLLN